MKLDRHEALASFTVSRQERDPPAARNRGGRPPGPSMRCGWGCGTLVTATQSRTHFHHCPNRPRPRWLSRNARMCLWEQDHTFSLIGRPRGPQMQCGWQCGAALTSHQMRVHFPRCPNRPLPGQEPHAAASAPRLGMTPPNRDTTVPTQPIVSTTQLADRAGLNDPKPIAKNEFAVPNHGQTRQQAGQSGNSTGRSKVDVQFDRTVDEALLPPCRPLEAAKPLRDYASPNKSRHSSKLSDRSLTSFSMHEDNAPVPPESIEVTGSLAVCDTTAVLEREVGRPAPLPPPVSRMTRPSGITLSGGANWQRRLGVAPRDEQEDSEPVAPTHRVVTRLTNTRPPGIAVSGSTNFRARLGLPPLEPGEW